MRTTTDSPRSDSRPEGIRGLPLTERVVARLPGPSWVWIAVWALLVLIRPAAFLQVLRAFGYTDPTWEFVTSRLPVHAVSAYMVVLSFWAVRRFAEDVRGLEPALARLSAEPGSASSSPLFAGLNGALGPLALTILLTAVNGVDVALGWSPAIAATFLPYIALPVLPMMTLFWVYLSLLLGLDRLGRRRMNLGPFPEDCSLGLGPVGALAFSAFLTFCAGTVPFLLVSLRDRFDLTVGLAFFVAGVGAFFLSMWRLHRQMVETKGEHLVRARALYGEAYEPLRPETTLEALQARTPLVSAAEAFEKRVLAIQEWPFDDRTMARIVGISTGVVTAIIARFVLRAFGF